MSEKRWRLLKVVEHNWGLTGPGDWSEVQWNIFHDGSYEIISSFNPTFEVYEKKLKRNKHLKPVKKKTTGMMDIIVFATLLKTIECEPWKDPTLNVYACDGVAWEIESYRDDGNVKNSNGKLDYVYGHRVLEKIVSLLPDDDNLYDSSANFSVSMKD